jgi:hypothetical protein
MPFTHRCHTCMHSNIPWSILIQFDQSCSNYTNLWPSIVTKSWKLYQTVSKCPLLKKRMKKSLVESEHVQRKFWRELEIEES